MKRVVITGVGAITPLGTSVSDLMKGLSAGSSAVQRMDTWDRHKGLQSLVAAPAPLENEKAIPRQSRRSMGRLSLFAVQAAQQAIADAGLGDADVGDENFGCIVGSTMGSAASITEAYEIMLPELDISLMPALKFFQCLSHTAAMNVAQYLSIRGMVMATSAACASGLQAIGTGYHLIRSGSQHAMLCGGAEETHPTVTGSFDVLYATSSHFNDRPEVTPRPFDRDRDGLVCGEGSGMLVLEEYERARARGAHIYGEIVGYHTCGSGTHVSQSNAAAMVACMRRVLAMAEVGPEIVDYVNAHATATIQGDKEEVEAIREVFGENTPVNSLKGYIGHTLGASGPIELIASLEMMAREEILATRNLEQVAPDCEGVRHVRETLKTSIRMILKNSFAFGNINASLLCRRVDSGVRDKEA